MKALGRTSFAGFLLALASPMAVPPSPACRERALRRSRTPFSMAHHSASPTSSGLQAWTLGLVACSLTMLLVCMQGRSLPGFRSLLARTWMRVWSRFLINAKRPSWDQLLGTVFASQQSFTTAELKADLIAVHRQVPPPVSAASLASTIDQLLTVYPDDPALGSPFNTGNELFGLPSSYKRQAAYSEC